MKKSLLWSFVAATAMMTGCSDDAMLDSQNPALTGEEVPVSFAINMGGGIGTYATASELGGWSNYKDQTAGNIMRAAYNHRAIIQVFAEGQTAPISQGRVVINTADGELVGNDIVMENLRLNAGQTYTAVVWVDFVDNATTASTTEATNDLYYDTNNLTEVKTRGIDANNMVALANTPEGRDAYTGTVKFTVAADGKYAIEDGTSQEIATAIPVTAKRPFGKVRLVLTDFNTKANWTNFLNNQNSNRVMDYISMTVGDAMATSFNALTGEPIAASATAAHTFHRAWSIADDAAANDVKWVTTVPTTVAAGTYPVLDFNYFIPMSNEDAAAYNIGIRAFDMNDQDFTVNNIGADVTEGISSTSNCLSVRNFTSIPVKKNTLTTIWGNFLTAGYSFTVTVDDLFNGSHNENVVVGDDGTKETTDKHEIDGAIVVVVRDNDDEATTIDVTGVTAANFDAVIANINSLHKISDAALTITAASLPATADFKSVEVGTNVLVLAADLAAATTFSGLDNNPFTVRNNATQAAALTIASTQNVTMSGTGTYAALNVDALKATIAAGIFGGVVTLNETSVDKNAIISGGTITAAVNSYSNLSIDGTATATGQTITMKGFIARTLTVNEAAATLGGTLDADKNGATTYHIVEFTSKELHDEYVSGHLGNSFNEVNYP